MDKAKLQEVFSDKTYVESILKLSAKDAAQSLQDKGVDVTADDLMKVRDFILAHKDELANGELSDEALAGVAGGSSETVANVLVTVAGGAALLGMLAGFVLVMW